jgi:hypothetical protein
VLVLVQPDSGLEFVEPVLELGLVLIELCLFLHIFHLADDPATCPIMAALSKPIILICEQKLIKILSDKGSQMAFILLWHELDLTLQTSSLVYIDYI